MFSDLGLQGCPKYMVLWWWVDGKVVDFQCMGWYFTHPTKLFCLFSLVCAKNASKFQIHHFFLLSSTIFYGVPLPARSFPLSIDPLIIISPLIWISTSILVSHPPKPVHSCFCIPASLLPCKWGYLLSLGISIKFTATIIFFLCVSVLQMGVFGVLIKFIVTIFFFQGLSQPYLDPSRSPCPGRGELNA